MHHAKKSKTKTAFCGRAQYRLLASADKPLNVPSVEGVEQLSVGEHIDKTVDQCIFLCEQYLKNFNHSELTKLELNKKVYVEVHIQDNLWDIKDCPNKETKIQRLKDLHEYLSQHVTLKTFLAEHRNPFKNMIRAIILTLAKLVGVIFTDPIEMPISTKGSQFFKDVVERIDEVSQPSSAPNSENDQDDEELNKLSF